MKSIRAKFFLYFLLLMGGIVLFNNAVFFSYTRKTLLDNVTANQAFIASSNEMGMSFFLKSIDQSFQFLTTDKLVGESLGVSYDQGETMNWLQARSDMKTQFYHCTTSLSGVEGYSCRSLLFLDDQIPLSQAYETATLQTNRDLLGDVYRNTEVKSEEWYRRTMELNGLLYVFVDEGADRLCLARKVQNLYYSGPNQKNGIGVMVIQMERQQLQQLFRFSQITPHTQVLLLNSFQAPLYMVNRDSAKPIPDFLLQPKAENLTGQRLKDDGQYYFVNTRRLEGDLTLAFLTPESDINSQIQNFQQVFLLGSLLIMAVGAILVFLFSTGVTHPIVALSNAMMNLRDTRQVPGLVQTERRDEIGGLYRSFGHMISRINDLLDDVREQTARQKTAELKALQAQINPHFLYNAMDAVNWIALSRNEDGIADMVSWIADIMRYAISNPDDIVTLQDELDNAETYVSLQQIRYDGRLRLKLDADEACRRANIPKMMLQPLIENSILHGIADSQDTLSIWVAARLEGDTLLLTESDDGRGGDSALLNRYLDGEDGVLEVKSGFGIRNVHERLGLKFQGLAGLRYRNLPSGRLEAVITLPLPGRPEGGQRG